MNEIATTWPPLSTLVAIGLLILIIVFLYFVLAKTLDKLYQVHKKHEKAHLELLHIFCWLRDPLNAPEPDMASHTKTENLVLINIHRLKTEPQHQSQQEIAQLRSEVARMYALRHELEGIAADVDAGNGFDEVCRKTLARVISALSNTQATAQAYEAEVKAKALEEARDWFATQQGWGKWAAGELHKMATSKKG